MVLFRSTVSHLMMERTCRQAIHALDDAIGYCALLEEWQEGECERKVADVINLEFLLEQIEVDAGRLGEVKRSLDTRVEEDTVQVWMLLGYAAVMVS